MIYLDYHAATPLLAASRQAMRRASEVAWANPSSVHAAGRRARNVLEEAREQIASGIHARPEDLVLTSGGTEACNLGVLGLQEPPIRRVITTPLEHPAVRAAVASLGEHVRLEVLPTPRLAPPPDLDAQTLVAMQWVNHETGDILPISDFGEACAAAGARLFVDATQALGRIPIDIRRLDGVSAMALASQKIGGPSGAGALWVRGDVELEPRELGGAQERGRRAGTPNLVALAGFGAACERLPKRLEAMPEVTQWRDQLEKVLIEAGGEPNRLGARVGSVSNLSMRGWRADVLVAALDVEGICVSAGAACSSGLPQPSPVIEALYPTDPVRAASAVRVSLGPEALDGAQIKRAAEILTRVASR